MADIAHDQEILQEITCEGFDKYRSLDPLTAFGRKSKSLDGAFEVLRTLEELHLDIEHFKAHR
jgi:hypothetical protein